MKSTRPATQTPIVASEAERKLLDAVESALERSKPGKARLVGPDNQYTILPESIYLILRHAVRELAKGNGVVVLHVGAKLTTQQAAEQLNVSRPFLIKLLERGEIPFHMAGKHRRIYLHDLLAYRDKRDALSREALKELVGDAQDLHIYDE
jgi:excisionase family DNA binding protein